eukprot:TRINITY_DN20877_c0_g1_i1.p1 TRINITY_DN20877_c0_g1~~TRINITY_DN20877_c0_g1_i1.p1  ORF type:complete len:609 (+),score=81.02 TRINITY_DN20877_c0_g1_i1:40-1866(+)
MFGRAHDARTFRGQQDAGASFDFLGACIGCTDPGERSPFSDATPLTGSSPASARRGGGRALFDAWTLPSFPSFGRSRATSSPRNVVDFDEESGSSDETTPFGFGQATSVVASLANTASTGSGRQRSYHRWNPSVIAYNLMLAQRDARRLRWRVSGPPLALGLAIFAAAVVIMIMNLRIFSPWLFCTSGLCAVLGGGLQLMALLPTDRLAVSFGGMAWSLGSVPLCAIFFWASFYMVFSPGDVLLNTTFSRIYGFSVGAAALFQAFFILRLSHAVRRFSTRSLLGREWRLFMEFCVFWGTSFALWGVLDLLASFLAPEKGALAVVLLRRGLAPASASVAPWWPALLPSGLLIAALGSVIASRSFPYMPRWLSSWLASLGDEISRAASIAAAVGGRDIDEVMSDAKARCRTVSLDRVTKESMTSNTPAQEAIVAALATPTLLGEIDTFVSHSWHDDFESKWNALQIWREEFKAHHGREPHCWIDKYCIDQNNISIDLMCLPIYLAGSRSLLVLLGETYLQRLWCIMEISTFIIMGGSLEAIHLSRVTTPSVDEERLRSTIRAFTVADATCTYEEDKDMLFSVVEAGFGDCDRFDEAVRDLLGSIERKCMR